MKDFFKGVKKHIGKLDSERLREQYSLVADELAFNETIFHLIDDGFLLLDANGETIWSNPAAEKLLGMKPTDILPRLELPLGKASKREIELSYPDPKVLEIQTVPHGEETLVKLSDITDRREKSKEELQAGATQAVRDLASGVAHEIGNPLNAISLNLQLLEREHPGDQSLTECRHQIARLRDILSGFLSALRPSKPQFIAGSIAEPLRNCLATLRAQLEERKIGVELEMPAALPQTALDPAQMEQVFFNLIKNSLEAIKEGGRIRIVVDSDDNDVIVRLADNGIGMSTEQITHLFEPYRTSKAHGTGLGLMITQRVIRDHGGTIGVESAVGEGTTFTVRLPRLEKRIRRLK